MYEARQNKEKVSRRIDGNGGTKQRMNLKDENKNTLKFPQPQSTIAQCFTHQNFRNKGNYTYNQNGGQRHYRFGVSFIRNHLSNRNRIGFINTHFIRQTLINYLDSNNSIAYRSDIAPYNSMIQATGTVGNGRHITQQQVYLYMYYNRNSNDYKITHCDQ